MDHFLSLNTCSIYSLNSILFISFSRSVRLLIYSLFSIMFINIW